MLDNFAFIGGNVEFIVVGVSVLFGIYNYNIQRFNLYYQHHKTRAIRLGKSDSV